MHRTQNCDGVGAGTGHQVCGRGGHQDSMALDHCSKDPGAAAAVLPYPQQRGQQPVPVKTGTQWATQANSCTPQSQVVQTRQPTEQSSADRESSRPFGIQRGRLVLPWHFYPPSWGCIPRASTSLWWLWGTTGPGAKHPHLLRPPSAGLQVATGKGPHPTEPASSFHTWPVLQGPPSGPSVPCEA